MTTKQPGEHLTHQIQTRWTAAEKAEVFRRAKAARVTVNTWIRMALGFPASNRVRQAKEAG